MLNDESLDAFPPRSRTSTLTTFIQHSTESSGQHNMARKGNKYR